MSSTSSLQGPRTVPAGSRALSALELLLGAFLVIGHNVFEIVPNEVPILVALGLLSIRLRNGGLSAMGLERPVSWRRIVIIALAAAALRHLVGELVILPLASRFWPTPALPEEAEAIVGNLGMALLALLFVWVFAAFGEEIAYRGYLLTRAAEVVGRSAAAYLVGMVVVAILFGYGHYSNGLSGVVDSGFAGLVLGAAYLLAGRNLWASILAHGFIDTFAVVVVYLGWAD